MEQDKKWLRDQIDSLVIEMNGIREQLQDIEEKARDDAIYLQQRMDRLGLIRDCVR